MLEFSDQPRSQAQTEFTDILKELVEGKSNAFGAFFFDSEGETVDYYSGIEEYQLKVAAAHLEIVARFSSQAHLKIFGCEHGEITFNASSIEFRAICLGQGYHLGLITSSDKTSQVRLKTALARLIPEIKKAARL